MYRYIALFITIIILFSGCGSENKVRIISDIENGEVTIDGKLKSSIRIGYSRFLLSEGEHTVLIEKPSLDGEWIFTGKKTFQIEADKVSNIEVETEKILTQKGKERVARELKIQRELEEKLALEKEEQEKQMEIARINLWNSTEVFQNNGFIWEDSSKVKEYMLWEEANNRCNNLEFAGSKEWRLPTKKELLELYKNKDSLNNLSANNYWTSQSSSQYYRVTVNFYNASVIGLGMRTDNRSRCVRDTLTEDERSNLEQAQIEKEKNELEASKKLIAKKANEIKIEKEKEYIANRLAIAKEVGLSNYPKGIYIDAKNKLFWQENVDANKRNFDDAEKYCENLSLAGFNNWRLPSVNELKNLTQKAKSSKKGKEWSIPVWSSDDAPFNKQKYIVIYKGNPFHAMPYSKYRSTKNSVRCVR
jgi:hypothetical protein